MPSTAAMAVASTAPLSAMLQAHVCTVMSYHQTASAICSISQTFLHARSTMHAWLAVIMAVIMTTMNGAHARWLEGLAVLRPVSDCRCATLTLRLNKHAHLLLACTVT